MDVTIRLAAAGGLLLLAGLGGLAAWRAFSGSASGGTGATVFPRATDQGYVGSDACRSCHETHHASWHATYHRTMTQPATPQTVLASFDNVRLEVEGMEAYLLRKGDEFWVDMVDPHWELEAFAAGQDASRMMDPPRSRHQIVMTTGSHHFQVYWYPSGTGRELWQFPWRYHLATGRWVHRRDAFLVGLPWRPSAQFQVWNRNCILCHSTGAQPGQDELRNVMDQTKVAELGISCEACHGPGGEHLRAMRQRKPGASSANEDLRIVNPARLSHELSSQICGRCHSHFHHTDPELFTTGTRLRPGDALANFGRMLSAADEQPGTRRYWADGTNASGGREFSGLAASACYQQGSLSCLSCHSMHASQQPADQLAIEMDGDEACLQCHAALRERLTEHTHHAADSAGSRCYNCHMPHTSFALLKAIRNHQIDSPRVVKGFVAAGRPNACNLCHLDQTLHWTSQHLADWYGHAEVELSEEERTVAASLVWLLRGDALQRAVVAWHLGWQPAQQASGTDWMAPYLGSLLTDRYSAVRWVAARGLETLPGQSADSTPDAAAMPGPRQAREALEAWLRHPIDEAERYDAQRLGRLLLLNPRALDQPRIDSQLQLRDHSEFMLVE